ncbi:MAG: hypothetical protein NTV58_09810 [Deltaproteobacteria bacterium]|nr:hypothetical protein [Deltaproteobacteria bacterium]
MKPSNKLASCAIIMLVIVVLVAVIALWLTYGHYPLRIYAGKLDLAAQYGDSFGMINSLFSGLAFAGIIITILLQWHELRLQRQELQRSVEAQRESVKEQKEFVKALREQAELQIKTQDILAHQADSLFLAAYIQALTASYEGPAAQSVPIEKRRINESMNHAINTLESRIETILGPTPHKTDNQWLASILDERVKILKNQWPKDIWQGDHPLDLWSKVIEPFGQWFEEFRTNLYSQINTADTVVTRIKEMKSLKEGDFNAFWDRGNSLLFELNVLIDRLKA